MPHERGHCGRKRVGFLDLTVVVQGADPPDAAGRHQWLHLSFATVHNERTVLDCKTVSPDLVALQNIVFEVSRMLTASAQLQLEFLVGVLGPDVESELAGILMFLGGTPPPPLPEAPPGPEVPSPRHS